MNKRYNKDINSIEKSAKRIVFIILIIILAQIFISFSISFFVISSLENTRKKELNISWENFLSLTFSELSVYVKGYSMWEEIGLKIRDDNLFEKEEKMWLSGNSNNNDICAIVKKNKIIIFDGLEKEALKDLIYDEKIAKLYNVISENKRSELRPYIINYNDLSILIAASPIYDDAGEVILSDGIEIFGSIIDKKLDSASSLINADISFTEVRKSLLTVEITDSFDNKNVRTANINPKVNINKIILYQLLILIFIQIIVTISIITAFFLLLKKVIGLEKIDKLKNEFISNVSHELITPLTSIQGFAKIIDKKFNENIIPIINNEDQKNIKNSAQIKANLGIIVTESDKLTNLINNIIELSVLESNEAKWNDLDINLSDIIKNIMEKMRPDFNKKNIGFISDIEENITYEIDEKRIASVIENLLTNALNFTEKGEVKCLLKKEQSVIVLQISDTGVGIAKENLSVIFEKFKQLGDIMTNKPRGTGLGLYTSKLILERYKGKIWVESELGKGSVFSFSLPII